MSERSARIRDLRTQRDELVSLLPDLEHKRAETVRENSYMRARAGAGVRSQTIEEIGVAEAEELAAHAALRDVRVEMHRLDAEIESEPSGGVGATLRRLRIRH
jgi:hypothetical protein